MRLADLDYELPPDRIARHPTPRREDSRLLVVERERGVLHDDVFSGIGHWLNPGDTLVVNETRVRPARLIVRRPSGGRVELLFVRPEADGTWRVLAGPARKAVPGARLGSLDGSLEVEVVAMGAEGERTVRVVAGDVIETLARLGDVPLPPYLGRDPEPMDRERYQTVFARAEGAVAAPTASLHFSESLVQALAQAGVRFVRVLLHVGPGTFRPVTTEDPSQHRLDPEWFEVSESAAAELRDCRARGSRIVAVGTTVVRALESTLDRREGEWGAASGWTNKLILPPYDFRAVDALVTNFHLPRTSLLLLVGAFAGVERVRAAYEHAIAKGYRFYSYGDAMMIV
jgi:S-adenosylmethionine:tRNA ribosyltransferase-isomerase